MMNIKAIETSYKGYRFRSRLEARWAVFFDTLGVKWEYEKEGYDLGEHGWYLPDFWLPQSKSWVEIKPADYKGNSNGSKAFAALSSHFKYPILLVKGSPGVDVCEYGMAWQGFELDVIAGYPHDRWALPECYHDIGLIELATDDESLQQWLGTSNEHPVLPPIADMVLKLDVKKDEDRQVLWKTYSDYLAANGRKPIWARTDHCSFEYDDELILRCHYHNLASPSVVDALQFARSARFEHGEQPNVY